jgi:hypothetical protein
MKIAFSLLAVAVLTTACSSRRTETVRVTETSVLGTPVLVQEQVITTLPDGYRVKNYRGERYYEVNNTVYRSNRNGYVVVERPW